MQKNRQRALVWLALTGLIGLSLFGIPQAGAQTGILNQSWGDYTWGAYGGNREASRQGREDIVARENYCSTSGCILRLESVEVRPDKARAGQSMVLATTYTIMTPDAVAIPVAITRDVYFQGKSLGRTKSMEMRKLNGTWLQEVDFTLPANAKPGTYTLKTKVTTGYAMSEKEVQFQVQ